jgi:hypothetical protein
VLSLFAMETTASGRKKWKWFAPLLPLACAIPPTINSIDNPRLAGLRGLDILRLVVIGFCVGVAFGMFMAGFVGERRSS